MCVGSPLEKAYGTVLFKYNQMFLLERQPTGFLLKNQALTSNQ